MILQDGKVEIVEEEKKEEKIEQKIELNQEKHNADKMIPKVSNNSIHVLKYVGIIALILFLVLFIASGSFAIYNINTNDRIYNGITIYGVDVSGLTKSEAVQKVSEKFKPIESSELKMKCSDYETVINPSEIELKYNIESAVNYAFSIGKKGSLFEDNFEILNTMINKMEITPTFSINETNLTKMLGEFSKELPSAVVEGSYYIENKTLIITKGKDGNVIDTNQTIKNIKQKLADFSFLTNTIELSLASAKPKQVDLAEIYKEVHKDAKDAYYTTNPYAVYPSETGIDFAISMDEAKNKLTESDKECKIALKTVYPKVTTNMIGKEAFPDLLGEFSTHYPASNTNRTTNLKLAAAKIDGTVLLPGETFSYNKVVGERTIAAGYKEAAIYQNGQVVDGLGGGVCQISTTLFNAALFANLKIVELHNHQFVPSYVGAGRDATVAYGSKDFQFSNSRKYAIKLECSVSGGIATFKIYGVKEDTEYDVKVNAYVTSQSSSYTKSTTYRTLYLDGKQVSKERVYSCTYKRH